MAYNVEDIAQWFINRAAQDVELNDGEYITPLKLQKMLYYAQGCYGAIFDKKLFEDDIKAWDHGPVVERIYDKYKAYGAEIMKNKKPVAFEEEVEALLEQVHEVFGKFTASGLRNLTHSEEPWKNTKRNGTIPYKTIIDFFKRERIKDDAEDCSARGIFETTILAQQNKIEKFKYDGKLYSFYKPYILSISNQDGHITHTDERLNMFVNAKSYSELLSNFYDVFALTWDFYSESNDEDLGKDAREIKQQLKKICKVTNA